MRYPELLGSLLPKVAPVTCGLRLASFFCCAGGIDLGFRSVGFDLAFANDISKQAVETFDRNLGHRPVLRDIRGVGAQDYPKGEIDVLTGGFPCVTFSTAGRRAGVTDDINGKLYLELCRVISEIKPKYFVAENVKGLLNANGGAAPKFVLAAFLRLGYRTAYQLVNMAEHGVPQTRERVIFVGVRVDQWRGNFRFPSKTHRLRKDKSSVLPIARSLLDAIGDLPAPGEHLVGNMHGDAAAKLGKERGAFTFQNSKPRTAQQPAHSQTSSGPNAVIVNHDLNGNGPRRYNVARRLGRKADPSQTITSSDATSAPFVANHEANTARISEKHAMSKRFAPSPSPSPTIVSEAANVVPIIIAARNADYANKPRSSSNSSVAVVSSEPPELSMAGGGIRRMTVRECARVQSFPDWYEFPESQSEAYRLVGNAVPPLYARQLAEAIAEYDRRRLIK